MSIPTFHVLEQGAMIRALGATALRSLSGAAKGPVACPGPWLEERLEPRSPSLIQDYVRHVGGDPSAYRGVVPAHLFPQWTFALVTRALAGVPYNLAQGVNAGCRLELRAPLPAGEPLLVRVRRESIDDDGRRALLVLRLITGTAREPEAVVAEMRALVPLASRKEKKQRERPTVPLDVRELSFGRIGADAGLDFAKLTGDFNPIHWIPAYARAAGFRTCILHGFSSMARAIEILNRRLFVGEVSRLAWIDVRFRKPLPLPAKVGVYVGSGGRVFLGDAPGGGAYMEGTFGERSPVTGQKEASSHG
jgi:MaoC like domain